MALDHAGMVETALFSVNCMTINRKRPVSLYKLDVEFSHAPDARTSSQFKRSYALEES